MIARQSVDNKEPVHISKLMTVLSSRMRCLFVHIAVGFASHLFIRLAMPGLQQ